MSKGSEDVLRTEVMRALSQVQEPELHNDLVSLGMIKELVVNDGRVSFEIELTTPACPLRDQIEAEARQAVLAVEGVGEVDIRLTSNVIADQGIQNLDHGSFRNAIAVASGKGGVGKTTVAVNIAVALAQSGARVGLLDADIYGPNVPTMVGAEKIPEPQGNKLVPAEAYGVKVMSIGFLVQPDQPLIWRGPMLHSAIKQFITDVAWGELDYLIIDLPPGTGDAQLSLAQILPLSGGVIVTLPQKISLEDARRGMAMFRSMDVPVLGVVENMSYLELPGGTVMDVFGQGGGEAFAKEANVPFLGAIPLDSHVREAGDNGVPIVVSHPESKVGKALIEVTETLAARVSVIAHQKKGVIPIEMID
jgi:ATP-binding protein involved in chromosome partitioning